jgi:hypothetical protein
VTAGAPFGCCMALMRPAATLCARAGCPAARAPAELRPRVPCLVALRLAPSVQTTCV